MTSSLISKSHGFVTCYGNERYISIKKALWDWQRIRRAPDERHRSKVRARALVLDAGGTDPKVFEKYLTYWLKFSS